MSRSRFDLHIRAGALILAGAGALVLALIVLLAAPPSGARAKHGRGHAPGGDGSVIHHTHSGVHSQPGVTPQRGDRHHQPGVHRGGPVRTYLALGDSLAFGYQQAKFEELLPNESPTAFDTGYVDDLAAVFRQRDPRLEVVNDGCPGETTDSFISGPCEYQLSFPLHHPYSAGPGSSQLADALSYLGSHRNHVSPITIDIGANDALGVAEHTCAFAPQCIAEHTPALIEHISTNLGLILSDLRAAAPHAKIVVLGLYDPFGEKLAGSDQLTGLVNEAMAGVASTVGARFADPLPVFNPHGASEEETICQLTNMCPEGTINLTGKGDIHPTNRGYSVLAQLILEQLRAIPPFGPPLFGSH
jgi:lysophospholipase L1-like esterase